MTAMRGSGGPRLVPERTVDSLFAIEAIRHNPHALIWSPTQTRRSYDHHVVAPGTPVWIIECKAVAERTRKGLWRTDIDRDQLKEYVDRGIPAIYILLARPRNADQPWERPCACAGGPCLSCCYDLRSLSWSFPLVAHETPIRRLQPWFGHWAWAITAVQLRRLMESEHRPRGIARSIETTDEYFESRVAAGFGAIRLCHFFRRARRRPTTGMTRGDSTIQPQPVYEYETVLRNDPFEPVPASYALELLSGMPRTTDPEATHPMLFDAPQIHTSGE